MSFNTVLEKYRKEAFSQRDKGERFERLMQAYLKTDPQYANRFKDVWMWEEFFGRKDLGGADTGIDLVALTHDGDFWAIQCKCYKEGSRISKNEVDSFIATSSGTFKNKDLKTVAFSHRLWIDTTGKGWGTNAEKLIQNQTPPVTRIGLYALQQAPIDWTKLDDGIFGSKARAAKKSPFAHQKEAMDKAHEHFKNQDRGKLIMACGTGKTYTALQIAEHETKGVGFVLFLVPSIALLGQTLREWSADASEPINAICICSDSRISKKRSKNDDTDQMSVVDLALPASTNVKNIIAQFERLEQPKRDGMTVVFSTYQSIEVIAKAQQELAKSKSSFDVFDLVICDEAHRTTGVALTKEDSSSFIKVHDNEFLRAKKRLYMTATPRLFNEDSKSKAAQHDAILCSMDDEKIFGPEFYRIGFGEAVSRNLLSDYKVLILTLSEGDIPTSLQNAISNDENEINADDASRLVGCINALSKHILGDGGMTVAADPAPMRRAVAFCPKIIDSKRITNAFNSAGDLFHDPLPKEQQEKVVAVSSQHIDGTMSAPQRDELMGWLKSDELEDDECRILTNVRCLSEGVDVPSLDAVMFLSARNSQVDVVQSVGRVMRKAPGKKYGYIIIPVLIPSDVVASEALNDNKRFAVVWTVLNALRAHDDRFNATINKIDLNVKRPGGVIIGGPGTSGGQTGEGEGPLAGGIGKQIMLQFEELQSAIYAKMVLKVGNRQYWEQWATSVAEIAKRQTDRITHLVDKEGKHNKAFANFLKGLQKNINPYITEEDAIEMLSQHIITKPVFDALFEDYSFVESNAISISMQKMLELLQEQAIEKDTEILQKFYDSVRMRAANIDNAAGKQKVIVELYDKFFKTAFPKMVEQLGIVYTPIEVVDFIIHSVNDVIAQEFGRSISDENVHVLDPFTGTGTFITRLIQSGLIRPKDLPRKYAKELHANEIVLLAYYIAAVNIENSYHDQIEGAEGYESFNGICLTDTFQLGENRNGEKLFSEMFPQNSARVQEQVKAPIRVIIGNPPYSVGQKSANDNAQNQAYPVLDDRIADTYAKLSTATNKNSLYDSYFKAFRWSTDRLDPEHGGVIGFVTNGAWIDGNSQDGFRKYLEREFSAIYVFNLRGNQRTSGELSRKEGGKIFGSGSRTPISITILVKNPTSKSEKATIHYHDIGDYLSRNEKLNRIDEFKKVTSPVMKWENITPDEHGDWLNKRNEGFEEYFQIQPDKKWNTKAESVFVVNSRGLETGRDSWMYFSSPSHGRKTLDSMISFYNSQLEGLLKGGLDGEVKNPLEYVSRDDSKISWTSSLLSTFSKGKRIPRIQGIPTLACYRPFYKQSVYFEPTLIHRTGQHLEFFPTQDVENRVICVDARGRDATVLITDCIPDLHCNGDTQAFPLYYYEEQEHQTPGLFDGSGAGGYVRRDGITDFILSRAQASYGRKVNKEDIFYYVYGLLHSPEYRSTYANDLKKTLPRIPLIEESRDFWKFSKAGRALAELHVNYEEVPTSPLVKVTGLEKKNFKVGKMRFPRKNEKGTILYNSTITVEEVPDKAYQYVVNGKSAIEWVMERYQVKTDKKSGIKNDPNDWCAEVGNERYILDLLLSVISVSVRTVDIVKGLPKIKF